ncbi:MAG: hypothetical protein ACD_18C00160G0001, partial [uncultured bacterium]
MLFAQNKKIESLVCNKCQGTGYLHFNRCPQCKKMHSGFFYNNLFVYFGKSITFYNIELHKARNVLNMARIIGALVFWLGFWAVLFFSVWQSDKSFDRLFTVSFWLDDREQIRILFWLGVIALGYLFYRLTVQNVPRKELDYKFLTKNKEKTDISVFNWESIKKISHKDKLDFSKFITPQTEKVLENSFLLAKKYNTSQITALHIFYILLSNTEIMGIFVRLGISVKSVQSHVTSLLEKNKNNTQNNGNYFGDDFWQILFNAFDISVDFKDSSIRTSELLLATVRQSEPIQEMLYDVEVENQKLNNVVEWIRMKEVLYDEYHKFRKAASSVSKYGMDRAMTSVATPYLNNYSKDLTLYAKYGHLSSCVAREKEIAEIFNIIESGNENVV